jgi:hypothetical protein
MRNRVLHDRPLTGIGVAQHLGGIAGAVAAIIYYIQSFSVVAVFSGQEGEPGDRPEMALGNGLAGPIFMGVVKRWWD